MLGVLAQPLMDKNMVYIKRNKDKTIIALYQEKADGVEEMLANDHPEVVEFLIKMDKEKQLQFLQSDLQFIRVLEDLIDILMVKNIINITDFPEPVVNKLLNRQTFRKRLTGAIGMEFNEDEML